MTTPSDSIRKPRGIRRNDNGNGARQQAGRFAIAAMLVLSVGMVPFSACSTGNATATSPGASNAQGQAASGAPQTGSSTATASGASAQSSPTSTTAPASYEFKGPYDAVIVAGDEEESIDEDEGSSKPDQIVALAQNDGTLTSTAQTLTKTGDTANAGNSELYGTNSALVAVGAESNVFAEGTALKTAGLGSNGVFATNHATVFANYIRVETASKDSCGVSATYGGKIIVNGLFVDTLGENSPAASIGQGGGSISITSSNLFAEGAGTALLQSMGTLEIDNALCSTSGSQLAYLEGAGKLVVSNSMLDARSTAQTTSDPVASSITMYRTTDDGPASATGSETQLQAANSIISSSLKTGTLFHFTNTQANVVLTNTRLDFDSNDINLAIAAGNSVDGWGTTGKNGADVTLTGIEQILKGDIEVDDISGMNVNLSNSSKWTGAATTVKSASATTETTKVTGDGLTVNIDATSTWVVTKSSTVSALNIASGGRLVDPSGKAVKIVDKDGNTLVDGASKTEVTVTNSFSAAAKIAGIGKLADASIDRSAFDDHFDTSTTFGENGVSAVDGADGLTFADRARGQDAIDFLETWLSEHAN